MEENKIVVEDETEESNCMRVVEFGQQSRQSDIEPEPRTN